MLETLKGIFNNVIGDCDVEITPKTKLNDELQLSSLGKIELVCAIEEYYDISIPNKALTSFKTVNDILKYLKKHT